MPCSDNRESPKVEELTSKVHSLNSKLNDLGVSLHIQAKTVVQLEAMLCALMSSIRGSDIEAETIAHATEDGVLPEGMLMDWYMNHAKKDKERLTTSLSQYSKHEQEIIRDILNKK